jgi:hypothetical protein
MFVRREKVDIVFVGYQLRDYAELKEILTEHGVPHITCVTRDDVPAIANELASITGPTRH